MFTLSGGKTGVLQTVSLMRQIVDRFKTDSQIRNLALSLVSFLPPKDETGEINAIFQYVRDDIRYVKDVYDVETIHTPDQIIKLAQGDCDDKSVLLAVLLESIGYQTYFKVTGYHGSDYEHVYVYVSGLGVAMHLDATEPESAGWEAPGATCWMYCE